MLRPCTPDGVAAFADVHADSGLFERAAAAEEAVPVDPPAAAAKRLDRGATARSGAWTAGGRSSLPTRRRSVRGDKDN